MNKFSKNILDKNIVKAAQSQWNWSTNEFQMWNKIEDRYCNRIPILKIMASSLSLPLHPLPHRLH
ncbi:hypothetical protein OUZ56_025983 [Daphnia magna]|uniref:Uncharacterized protein n=1 Tax=Daphnia magna TaxID=35525 RepID=A0ABQ9ZKI2_9CRUS|nr:hypothetical protein OUZ56_025983 [Daphnia magna]